MIARLFCRLALAVGVVLAVAVPAFADVPASRDLSFKAPSFDELPRLDPKATLGLNSADRAKPECVALCEFAAAVDADPFGYGPRPRPFEGDATSFGRQYQYAHDNPTLYTDPSGNAVVSAAETEALRGMLGRGNFSSPTVLGKPGQASPSFSMSPEQQATLAAQVEALTNAGLSHSAAITIEQGDFEKGSLNSKKVLDQVYARTGRFAAEIDGLDAALKARIAGAKAGDSIGVSDLYSEAYNYSSARATEEARKASPWDFTGTGHELALAEFGRQGLAPAGFEATHTIGAGMAAADAVSLLKMGGVLVGAGLAKALTKVLPQLPEGYFYRQVGGQTQVVRNAGRSADLPALHLENGTLQMGPSPGTLRSIATRSAYLRQIDPSKYPKWMRTYLEKGQVPPGFTVHHKKALFDGGTDTIDNMLLQAEDLHSLRHKYYRPGGRFPSINPPK